MPIPRQAGFLFTDDGPALVEMTVRASQTQPARLKVGFVVELDKDMKLIEPTGEEHALPVPVDSGQKMLCGSEFRLEMN